MIASASQPEISDHAQLLNAFRESERDFRVHQAWIGCILVLICMPAGAWLDWFVYPEHVSGFFIFGRLLCDVAVAPLYWILTQPQGRKHIAVIGLIWPLLPAVSISWMIYATNGSASPYYAGLLLVLIVACQLMPYTLREAAIVCASTLALYLIACGANAYRVHVRQDVSNIASNVYFVVITTVICLCSCHYASLRHFRDFKLRRDLDDRNRRLAELDQLKSQFFANVSHELRTPLTLILAPTEELLSRRSALTPQAASTLGVIRQNSLRLLKLITDLLEIVRLDERPGPPQRESVELGGFVRDTIESVRHLATQKRIRLEYFDADSPVAAMADPSALEKVVLNLLTNAIKFTPSGGAITVGLRRESDEATLTFQDTGIGIPAKDLPHIFERFRQVDGSATRKFQGMGIGLALARELVQEHGGTLLATSVEGRGSTFSVRLPIAKNGAAHTALVSDRSDPVARLYHEADRLIIDPQPQTDPEKLAQAEGDGEQTVLVIEDELELRRFVVSLLTNSYRVRQAADGKAGLDAVRAHRPELVLVDLMLPEMDGLAVCRQIKNDPDLRHTKVVLLTARTDEQSKLTALQYGADDFIQKPFSTTELRTRVANLLQSARLEQEMRDRNVELAAAIEKLKSTEVQLVQSEKMNAVGRLSAGILHEINNPLNAAKMAVYLAKSKNSNADIAECLTDLQTALDRIRTVTTDLRSFAYPNHDTAGEAFTIGAVLTSAERLLAHDLTGLTIARERVSDLEVRGSKNQIVHVLINLISNAATAVGAISSQRPPELAVETRAEAGRLITTVRDNGVGIDPENLARVTEPFFTTRDVGQGMGLGLSICHTIVRNHGGNLHVESEKGEWTKVSFDLPLEHAERTS